MDSAISEYLSECEEILQRVSSTISSVEKGAPVAKHIDAIYRDFHTLKGSSQLFGFSEIAQVAHALEAGFGPIRTFKLNISSRLTDQTFRAMDLIDRMVKYLAAGSKDLKAFEGEIKRVLPAFISAATQEFGLEYAPLNESFDSNLMEDSSFSYSLPPSTMKTETAKQNSSFKVNDPKVEPIPEKKAERVLVSTEEVSRKIEATEKSDTGPMAETTIRVQVDLLDRLMNLAGELVLVRNQMIQHRIKNEDVEFLNLSKSLDLVTSDLQTEVMKTRMQPIGSVLNKFQRVVRDLGKDLGKQIDLTIQGAETELDKTLLEAIKDPMTHIIRNACDHGIETTAERKSVGKPINGHLMIRSFHEGGLVVVEISDDGKGLDAEKLKSKAVEKGILTKDKAEKMSERDAYSLIFAPGFSTAKQVTSVSGRGVGMDVVKTNIEKIGGSVELSSRLGKGTTIKLKIPLTLAIVPALVVTSGKERYAIPQVKLVELVRISKEESWIEFIQGQPTYRLRGAILPLVFLEEGLGLGRNHIESDTLNMVVLNADGEKFGLIVDEVLDTTDIVVKPLSPFLKGLSTFSGATIMGDGTISLILDVVGIAEQANLAVRSNKKLESFEDTRGTRAKVASGEVLEFLLVKTAIETTHAIPLCLVNRLEELPANKVEVSGGKRVIQYRGTILPLIFINEFLKYSPAFDKNSIRQSLEGNLSVVVIDRNSKPYGLVVDEILDVTTIEGQIDDSIRDRNGILGNLIYGDRILVVLDALGIIESSNSARGDKDSSSEMSQKSKAALDEVYRRAKNMRQEKIKILYAEDVAFFRKQVSKVLSKHGFEVIVAENGVEAMRLLEENGSQVSLVLSDIEMPEMNGLDFAKAVRASEFSKLPMIALTTRYKESDLKAGREAGFDLYLEKLNEEKLMNGIFDLLKIDTQSRSLTQAEA